MSEHTTVRAVTGVAVLLFGIVAMVSGESQGSVLVLLLGAAYVAAGIAFMLGETWAAVLVLAAAGLSILGGAVLWDQGSQAIGLATVLVWALIAGGAWYARPAWR